MKKFLRVVWLYFASAAVAFAATTLRLSVGVPENNAGLAQRELDTFWIALDAAVKEVAGENADFVVVRRGVSPCMRVPEKTADTAEKPEADLVFTSSIGYIGGKYLLTLGIWENAKAAVRAGSTVSMNFKSLEDLLEQMPFFVKKSLKSSAGGKLVAVLFPVVSFPQCPKNLPQSFHEQLQRALKSAGYRLAVMDDINSVFAANGLDPLQSLPPRMYPKVAKQLNVDYLMQIQIMNCTLAVTEYNPGLQRPAGKLLNGVFSGTVKIVALDGTILGIHPFEMLFDFNRLLAAGAINVSGWGYDQYYSYMASTAIATLMPELQKGMLK